MKRYMDCYMNNRKMFLCNLGIEEEWNNDVFTDSKNKFKLINIEEIAMFLCSKEDICVVRIAPEKEFLDYMSEVGFVIPTFLVINSDNYFDSFTKTVQKNRNKINNYVNNNNLSVVAYAYTEKIDIFCGNVTWLNKFQNVKKWNNKLWMSQLIKGYGISSPDGVIIKKNQDVLDAYFMLRDRGFLHEIIKMPYGASGKGSYLVNDEHEARTIARICLKNSDEGILLEGYYENAINYSYQLKITEDEVGVFFISEQIVENTVYKGSYWGNELCNRLNVPKIREVALQVGNVLKQEGIRGVVGIDGILSGNQYFPAIDVNVRQTMSTFLSNMSAVLGVNRSYMSWMQDVCFNRPMPYSVILNILEENNIKYNVLDGVGIIVYIDGTLPKIENEDGLYIGRIYAVCVTHSYYDCLKYKEKFEKIIRRVSESR